MKRPPVIPILLVLFSAFTLLEIYLIFQLAQIITWPATIAIALMTGVIGSFMIKKQGIAVWRQGMNKVQQGQFPAQSIAEGVMIIIGGAFLMTPGVITDVIGLSTLVPPIRALYGRFILRFAKNNFKVHTAQSTRAGGFSFMGGMSGGVPPREQAPPQSPPQGNRFKSEASSSFRDEDYVDVEFERKD